MATVTNLIIDQGTTYSTNFTVRDSSGNARDLAEYDARSQLRRSYYASTSVAFTANVTSPANGIVTISLTDAQTANLKPGRYVYDVEIVSPSSTVERIVEGIITIAPEVTK